MKKNKMFKRLDSKENMDYSLMALPGILLVFVFMYIPMGGLVIAFEDYKYDTGFFSKFVGLKNFDFFFTSADAGRILYNPLVLNTVFIIVGIICALAVAIMMFQIKRKLCIKVYQSTMMLPYFLSWVIVGCMTYAFLNPSSGLLNSVLKSLNMETVDWYAEPKYWPYILAFCSVWKSVGYNAIMYYAGLMGIDTSLFEAAELDGATKMQKIRYICLPSISQLVCILTLMSFGSIFRSDFGLFYQVTRNISKLYPTTDVIDTYVYRALRENSDVGMSAAVGFFQSVVGFVTILAANLIVKKINNENALF